MYYKKIIRTTALLTSCLFATVPLTAASASPAQAPAVQEQKVCNHCNTPKPGLMSCAACQESFYCSKDCQVANWPQHKEECKEIQYRQMLDQIVQTLLVQAPLGSSYRYGHFIFDEIMRKRGTARSSGAITAEELDLYKRIQGFTDEFRDRAEFLQPSLQRINTTTQRRNDTTGAIFKRDIDIIAALEGEFSLCETGPYYEKDCREWLVLFTTKEIMKFIPERLQANIFLERFFCFNDELQSIPQILYYFFDNVQGQEIKKGDFVCFSFGGHQQQLRRPNHAGNAYTVLCVEDTPTPRFIGFGLEEPLTEAELQAYLASENEKPKSRFEEAGDYFDRTHPRATIRNAMIRRKILSTRQTLETYDGKYIHLRINNKRLLSLKKIRTHEELHKKVTKHFMRLARSTHR